jgi:hypothetical protein
MKIFLAGENRKKHIIRKLANVNIFSGGGESRHWLQAPLIEDKKENIPCRRILQEHGERNQADCMGGGFPEEIANATILSKPTHDTEIQKRSTNGDFPVRGGYA